MKEMLKDKTIIVFIALFMIIIIMGSFKSKKLDEINQMRKEELLTLNVQ